jgi:hypothetical protein
MIERTYGSASGPGRPEHPVLIDALQHNHSTPLCNTAWAESIAEVK